ncbi:hypothetical protein [Photorhabdus kayaii]|nr:hypothetical protein [Photorhabdus kayaii]MCT8354742.1 hypothetical protein [Photorhabdus kayaii]
MSSIAAVLAAVNPLCVFADVLVHRLSTCQNRVLSITRGGGAACLRR